MAPLSGRWPDLGVNRKTIAAWVARPAFVAQVRELRTEHQRLALTALSTRVLPKAVAALESILDSHPAGPASNGDRLRAAEIVLKGSGLLKQGGLTKPEPPAAVQIVFTEEVTELARQMREENEKRREEKAKRDSGSALHGASEGQVVPLRR